MRYGYIIITVCIFLVGGYCGFRLAPRSTVSQVAEPTIEKEVTRTVVKARDGSVQVTTTERAVSRPTFIPQPSKAQYRLGLQIPFEAFEVKNLTLTGGRRLFGDLWVEAQYNIKRKEALLGLSYEF